MKTVVEDFSTYEVSVKTALDRLGAREVLGAQTRILIKPNLVNATPPPVTTPVDFTRAVAAYVRECSAAEIIIGEGCGDMDLSTGEVFDRLGYRKLSDETGIPLVDLNCAELRKLENPECPFLPEIYLPEIVFGAYIISLPVLKAHSLSTMTGSLKNMIGLAPPKHYSGQFGSWKKAVMHEDIHQAIIDLNRYRRPDLTVMDASEGLADYHLGGRKVAPPPAKLIAGFDPLEADRTACGFLDLDWKTIPHLAPNVVF